MAKNEIPKVTEKNTKAELMDAFNKVVAELEAKAVTVMDPVKEASEKATKAVVSKVESINVGTIQGALSAFTSNLEKLQSELAVYNDVQSAIDAKNAELKEMFSIEKSAYTLAALINTQNELKESFEKASSERKAQALAALDEISDQIEAKKVEFQNESTRLINEQADKRRKEEAEYKYATERQRKIDADKFSDEMADKRKALAIQIEKDKKEIADMDAELNTREAKIKSRETEIADMEAKIAQFPGILENAVKKAEVDGQKTAATSYGFETRYLKKEYEGEVALLNNKIETLTKSLDDANARNENLLAKLDDSSARLEALATKTVEGASNAKLVSTLETALRDKNSAPSK